jgi:hypothetical protein
MIIATEPLITVGLAWLFLRQALSRGTSISFIFALVGFFFLAGFSLNGLSDLTGGGREHFIGNVIMLVSLIGEALYSVVGTTLLGRGYSPVSIYAWANLAGVMGLTIAVAIVGHDPLQILGGVVHHLHWKSAVGLLWLGPLGTTATYLYWMGALRGASVASLALTLFIQPIFGSIWGYVFLDERLTALQASGGVLIIVAVFAQSVGLLKKWAAGAKLEKIGLLFIKLRFYTWRVGGEMDVSNRHEEATGQELLDSVANLTGLPEPLVQQELQQILEGAGQNAGSVTLDELRQAMLLYLESLAELGEFDDDGINPSQGPGNAEEKSASGSDLSFIPSV